MEQLDGAENAMHPRFNVHGPGIRSGYGWGQPRPWVSESFSSDQPSSSNALLRKTTDSSGRSMCVDSIVSNVYVKIPDDSVCTQAIPSDIAAKIGTDDKDLTLLDSKFVPVTDDDDKGLYFYFTYQATYLNFMHVDIEFWRMPSRCFYVARSADLKRYRKLSNARS